MLWRQKKDQKKKKHYVTTGVQMSAGVKMNVRMGVRLPDSEAGMEPEDGRQPFQCTDTFRHTVQDPAKMPLRLAVALLCALLIALSVPVIRRATKNAALDRQLNELSSQINSLSDKIAEQEQQVKKGREKTAITYAAQQTYHLIDPSEVKPQMVKAPDTRPNRAQNAAEAINEHLSGSR